MATFFGPSAPRKIGRSARSGWVIDLSGLPRSIVPSPAQRHLVVLALEVERLLAGEDAPDDLDVLPGAGERLRVRLAVPALDHLGPRRAEAEDGPAAGEVVERSAVIADGGRRAARDLA